MKTYALKQVVVDTGLTWQEAKTRRNANRRARLQIVPERVE